LDSALVSSSLLSISRKPQKPSQAGSRLANIAPFAAIIVAAFLMFFGMLGAVPLFNPDEGLYAEPGREMLETGEYVTTLNNYAVRFTKPPLVIWAMALSFKFLGVNEFAARFFVASCGFILVLTTYLFAERYLGKRVAFLSAFMLITSPLYIGVAREAITDMPLSLFVAAAIMAFYVAFKERSTVAKWSGYVLVALAVMTKGPVGLLLPFAIMLSYFYLRGQLKESFSFFSILAGAIVVALISLPWYVIEIYITNGAYFNEFIMRENFARFTSLVDAHKGPFWYHFAAVMVGFFPWSLLLPQLIVAGWRWLFPHQDRTDDKTNSSSLVALFERARNQLKELDQRSEILLLCSLTALVFVGFFSMSVSKLLPYTLPAFPSLALIAASYLDSVAAEGKGRKLLLAGAAAATIYGGVSLIGPIVATHIKEAPLELIGIVKAYGLCIPIAISSAVALALRKRLFGAITIFTCALFALTCIFGAALLPEASRVFEEDVPSYARQTAASKDPILVYDLRKPGITFYSRRKMILPPDFATLTYYLRTYKRAYVITKMRDIDHLLKIKGLKLIDHGRRFAFLLWEP
jgi:4-amino-4-deoxy-L-arabinose transferase-like glycosyltransferase